MAIQLSKQQQQYLAAGAILGLALGFVYIRFFWLPISQAKGEAREKIAEIEAKITKAKQQAARLDRLKTELASLNQQAVEAEKRLPKSKSVPEILLSISKLAQVSRVKIQTFTPGRDKPQQYFTELAYPMSVRGSYHNVGRFLAAIALQERIYNVRDISYPGGGADGEMIVTFTLLSYQYKG